MTITHRNFRALAMSVALGFSFAAPNASAYNWLQFNGDPAHSGNNTQEKAINVSNVASVAFKYQVTLPAVADGAPVFLRAVATASGVKDLLFVTTKAGDIVALDAKTGATVWNKLPLVGTCHINNGANVCYTTSSPAIDPNRQYVYSYGLDGYVHKYQVGDGTEILTGGWPQLGTLKGFNEKGSAALAFATAQGVTYLYVVHGGYPGDAGDYQGHVTAINLATGAQNVFNTMCSNQTGHLALGACNSNQSAIWARPSVIYDSGTNRIFMGTGNGNYTGNGGGNNWSESIIALNPNATGAAGRPIDAYTPTNFQQLDNADADLGSTAPAILPVPANSAVQHLAIQAGKDGQLRLVNLANLSAQNGPGNTGGEIGSVINVPQGTGAVLTQPAVWVNPFDGVTWVFVANGNGISGLKLQFDVNGNPSLVSPWLNGQGGTSPIVANNILYYAAGGALRALDPTTGISLWSTSQIGSIHWQSPIVANGWVYVTDQSAHLVAFAPPIVPVAQDFNANGKTDVLLRDSASGQSVMWLMNGAAAASGATIMQDPSWTVAQVGDFNGDGKADLLWRNSASGASAIWFMNGSTLTSGAGLLIAPTWTAAFVADFNGDNKSDIVWRNTSTGQTAIWVMNGAGAIAGGTIMTDPNWVVTQVADFNGDGKSDLVWRNSATGATAIWLMNGGTLITGGTIMTDPNWVVTQVGDFDGDGKSDLIWRNSATGQTAMWLMDGATLISGGIIMPDANWSVTKVADFDGDGRSDLVWRNSATGETAIWLMNGTTLLSGGVVMSDPNWSVTNVGDFNGDGKSDLVWRNSVSGASAVWLMNGTTLLSGAALLTGPTWSVVNPQ
jgi:FG-GAP-like repeat/PQQ-like domain